MATATQRQTAEQRREQVLGAAVAEFAEHGYRAARTAGIAERAGISQPYVYALFADKKELFLACHRHAMARIRGAFTEAARGTQGPEEALHAMGDAYLRLLEDRDELLFQLQAHAAAGDPELREECRRGFMDLWRHVARVSGASEEEVRRFIATGMLLNVVAALGLPDEYCPKATD